MIQAIFSEIKGFLDKDFLFGSMLPSLVFLASVGATFGGVFGFEGTLGWLDTWTATQTTMSTLVALVGLIVFAYIINSLRVVFLNVWSGLVSGPFAWLLAPGEYWFRKRYQEEHEDAHCPAKWRPNVNWFSKELQPVWLNKEKGIKKQPMSEANYRIIKEELKASDENISDAESTKDFLFRIVIPYFKEYQIDKRLVEIYKKVKDDLEKKANEEEADLREKRFKLDREFGTGESIRPTTLGNIVESYNAYSFLRYKIEGEVFWPHLQLVNKDYMNSVREHRIILDFYLTMASLGVVYALLAILGGPWLWFNMQFWMVIFLVAVFVSYVVYYRLAIVAARQYGDMIRATFDLCRRDLLKEFLKPVEGVPTSYPDEIKEWKNLSRLVVYGSPPDRPPDKIDSQIQKSKAKAQSLVSCIAEGISNYFKQTTV